MKKVLTTILLFVISLACLLPSAIYAENLLKNEKDFAVEVSEDVNEFGVSTMFSNFIDNGFKDLSNLCVLDTSNSDITENFISEASKYYFLKDYKSIQRIIESKKLKI